MSSRVLTPKEIANLISEDLSLNNGLLIEAGDVGHLPPGVKKMPLPSTKQGLEPTVYKGQMFYLGGSVPLEYIPSGEVDSSGAVVRDSPVKSRRPMFSLGTDNKFELVGYVYDDGKVELTGSSAPYDPKLGRPKGPGGASVKCIRVIEKDPKTGTRTVRYCKPELRSRMEKFASSRSKRGIEVEIKDMTMVPRVSDNNEYLEKLKAAGKSTAVPLDCKPRAL